MTAMRIRDIQQRLQEVGRIRTGATAPTKNGRKRPTKLETFRLTSPNKSVLERAAVLWGGNVKAWQPEGGGPKQWELITDTDRLQVAVLPDDRHLSAAYELWNRGGCVRRCDGFTETIKDTPCVCDPDDRECAPTTRLSLVLPDLPGLGVWRLETKSFHAAAELPGAFMLLQQTAQGRLSVPALLRLEQRQKKRDGQTRQFAVPVLDIGITVGDALAIAAGAAPPPSSSLGDGAPAAIEASSTPALPPAPPEDVETVVAKTVEAETRPKRKTARSAPAIPAATDTDLLDGPPPEAEPPIMPLDDPNLIVCAKPKKKATAASKPKAKAKAPTFDEDNPPPPEPPPTPKPQAQRSVEALRIRITKDLGIEGDNRGLLIRVATRGRSRSTTMLNPEETIELHRLIDRLEDGKSIFDPKAEVIVDAESGEITHRIEVAPVPPTFWTPAEWLQAAKAAGVRPPEATAQLKVIAAELGDDRRISWSGFTRGPEPDDKSWAVIAERLAAWLADPNREVA